jgi:hypothetical protein
MGASDQIDVATLTFELPIWLALPSKVKKLGVVQRMIASVYDANGNIDTTLQDLPTNAILCQRVITPMEYGLVYYNNTLRLIKQTNIVTETLDGAFVDPTLANNSWKNLIDDYGLTLLNGTSEIRLDQPNGSTLIGTVSYHPTDSALLLFSPFLDTVPANTVTPVTAIIDPLNMPVDSTYINAVTGTRYLILNDIGSAAAWGGIVAKANDIIEFNGTNWQVAFVASTETDIKYLTNLKSGLQFKWLPDQQQWFKSTEGKYEPESWAIVLSTLQ